jgi:cell division protein FtsZ
MCFIAAGMGGGTGTGAAPIIARAARDRGVLTVGVVTKPFLFEGTRRMRAAEAGIEELQQHVDTLIVIPNQNLFLVAKAETTFKEAFHLADEVLQQGVRSITDLMVMPGLINLDFADVRSVMAEMGKAMMGTGEGEGENRALEAAERAIANPLLDGVSMQGAKGVIISIIGGEDMKLLEVDEAANHIRELVDPEANIIWGSAFNPDLSGSIRVSVVATGIEQTAEQAQESSRPLNLGRSRGPVLPTATPPEPEAAPEPEASPEPEQAEVPPVPESYDPEPESGEDPEPLDLVIEEASDEPEDSPFVPEATAEDSIGIGEADDEEDEAESEAPYASLSGVPAPGAAEPLDLSADNIAEEPEASEGGQDELLLDASRLVERNEPVAPLSGEQQAGAAEPQAAPAEQAPRSPVAGSTLFERMANLSRGTKGNKGQDEDDDDGSSLNIPRFLGRQNNQ